MSSKTDIDIVHEGWLTKSPPSKRIWRARWRRRWFVLRHSGELPGQYYLYYYTDRNCRTLKGQIDLDQCEQVDAGLRFENNKQKYQHMFDVRTPKRTYYLAAETEADMNRWVDCVCHVCGLKAYTQEDNLYVSGPEEESSIAEESNRINESPPVSPSSTASGPYIPISECISGKPFLSNGQHCRDDFYDSPRRLQPPSDLDLRASGSTTPPLQSPATDVESVFTDEEWANPNPRPSVNWETFPRPSDSSLEENKPAWSVGKRYTKPVAPPRPPKPQHLVLQDSTDSHTYLNLDEPSPKSCPIHPEHAFADMYDFPRSHQLNGEQENLDPVPLPRSKHCYTNAAPGHLNGDIFCYDFHIESSEDDPVSPHLSETSSIAHYSNLSSPLPLSNPPIVNRGLKPGRKISEPASNEVSPQPGVVSPPNVDRNLKPTPALRKKDPENVALKLCAPPAGRAGSGYSHNSRHNRAAPSPTPRAHSDNSDTEIRVEDHEQAYLSHEQNWYIPCHPRGGAKKAEIQYLDLDLDSNEGGNPSTPPGSCNQAPKSPPAMTATVYKTVDFLKTEAFNRTRQELEEKRNKCSDVM